MELQRVSPNTRNAHRIIMLAREDGLQMEVAEAFFKAYFTDGVNLSDVQNLLEVAAHAGMDRTKVEQLLESNTGKLEIEMAEKEMHDLGINSVPLFIIDDRLTISGAQSIDAFTQAFEEAAMVNGSLS